MLFSLVGKNLLARPLRSSLTVLGIGISIAVIMALFALATDLKEELGATAQITQADLVATQRGLSGPTGGSIPESRIKDIAQLEGVERTTGFLLASVSLPDTASFNLFGVIPQDEDLYLGESHTIEGRYVRSPGEIVLGRLAMNDLGIEVGEIFRMESGADFTVVGIYQTGNLYLDGGAVITLEEGQVILGKEGKVALVAIYLLSGADQDKITQEIESQWRYLKVKPSADLLETSATAEFGKTLAWVLAAIAIMMGSVGIINTMFMSVSERTREIGIMKAVGWSQFDILRMIFSESMILSLLGFVIGSLLGILTIWATTSLPSVEDYVNPSFTADAFLVGLAVALVLGALGGVFPAHRALRLSPVEALRHE